MNKWIAFFAAAVALAGCFDNKGKPEDVPTVIGLEALASTNRAGIVRVILRGEKGPIPEGILQGLSSVKMIDVSERGEKAVPPAVLALDGIKEFYSARNGMESFPDLSRWAATLDYLNLDGNKIDRMPESASKLARLKWLRLNDNNIGELPASLSALKDMRRIYLKGNRLSAVPEVIREWPMIEDVTLDGNPISSVPEWLLAMPRLRALSLNGTKVERLPEDLSPLAKLDLLSLGGCPIRPDEMRRIRKALPDVAIVF